MDETEKKEMSKMADVLVFLTLKNDIREFKHDVYSRRQTAKITSDFLFFSCNP